MKNKEEGREEGGERKNGRKFTDYRYFSSKCTEPNSTIVWLKKKA